MKCEEVTLEVPVKLMDNVRKLCKAFRIDQDKYLVECIYKELEANIGDKLESITRDEREQLATEIKESLRELGI